MFSHIKELFTRPSGYTISRSVRLRSSAQGYFSKTLTTPTNNKKWTYSVWIKRGSLSANRTIMSSNVDGAEYWDMRFNTSDQIYIQNRVGSSNLLLANTTAVYRDPSAWYHIVFVFDSANATAANRNLLYVNGVNVSLSANSGSSDASAWNTSGIQHNIGVSRTLTSGGAIWAEYDGYLTEINFIDGQALTPSSFGETDSITGVWKAKKYGGTYGTNGFYLNFSDNSSNTATTIGKDYSGNGNNWTPNNISVTSGVTYDSMMDSPTVSAVSSNYCVMNPLDITNTGTRTIQSGNLDINTSTGAGGARSTFQLPTSGKWYFEGQYVSGTWSGNKGFGIGTSTADISGSVVPTGCVTYNVNGNKTSGSAYSAYGASYTTTDVVGIAVDQDAGTVTFYKNNTSQGAITHGLSTSNLFPLFVDPSSAASVQSLNFGQRPFSYTPPSGYVALNTYNLPASTITNGAAYMAATLYAGSSSAQSITNTVNGVSFQPDLVWGKNRSNINSHRLTDSVRGVGKVLFSNDTAGDTTGDGQLSSFNSNGWTFTSGVGAGLNESGNNYVAWNWKAGGTSSSNTNGSITSTVSVGATQGFSVVTYTGTGANATVGHGLGVAPSMIIIKKRSASGDSWVVYHSSLTNAASAYIYLNLTNAANQPYGGYWNSTAPTSTVFSLGTDGSVNANGATYVAYCFAAVKGFSAFGSYTGNGSADGPFVYCGFRPRFILLKRTDTTGDWTIVDTARNTSNLTTQELYPDLSNAENASTNFDILSNGFKLRGFAGYIGASGGTYIFAAFAENPFKNALAR